jgi:hypothetical protein
LLELVHGIVGTEKSPSAFSSGQAGKCGIIQAEYKGLRTRALGVGQRPEHQECRGLRAAEGGWPGSMTERDLILPCLFTLVRPVALHGFGDAHPP